MTLQTRRQAEKEKHKKSEKRKDSTGSTVEKEGKRQKLNTKDAITSSTENSSVSVSKKENSKKGRGGSGAAAAAATTTTATVDETIKNEEEVKKENDDSIENELDQGSLTFNEDEKVLCFHGPLIYEAKILKGELWENKQIEKDNGPHYYVHYKGWKQKWDEWVPESRVLKYNDINLKRQSDLKASVNAQKNSKYHEKKITDTGTDRGRKRFKDIGKEEEFIKRPEIKIVIPDLLKLQLVDDWESITKDQKLVTLPRKPSVAEILDDYKKLKVDVDNKDVVTNDVVLEMLNGIKQYFDKALGNILLYHFERQQYVQVVKDYPDKEMSSIYGAEHLLRLFVQFPQLLAYTNMDQDSMTLLRDQFTEFLEYMADNKKKMFQIEYENASPIYISLVKDS